MSRPIFIMLIIPDKIIVCGYTVNLSQNFHIFALENLTIYTVFENIFGVVN